MEFCSSKKKLTLRLRYEKIFEKIYLYIIIIKFILTFRLNYLILKFTPFLIFQRGISLVQKKMLMILLGSDKFCLTTFYSFVHNII